MRLLHKRIPVVVLLLAVMLLTCPNAGAYQSRVSAFSESFTVTGYGAEDLVAIALAQVGKTGKELGYSEEWCCDFICDCAALAGQSAAIPAYGYCSGLYSAILSAGGTKTTSSPQPGDICFINWDGGSSYQHAEIIYKVDGGTIYTVGGNSGGGSSLSTRCVYTHDPLSKKYVVTILRPNYAVLDTSYITKCTRYSTYCTVRVTADTALMSQPCTAEVDEDSTVVSQVSAGTELTAICVYQNSLGQLWYGVASNGETSYLSSASTEFVGAVTSGISITGVGAPDTLTEGSSFSVAGTIQSGGAAMSQVYGYVLSGSEVLTGTAADTTATSYSLKSSAVNKGLKFSVLKPGTYTFVLGVVVKGYYAGADGALLCFTQDVELHRSDFTVTEKPAHVCSWRFTGYSPEHPHVACYCCDGCGATKTDDSKCGEREDCEICFPEPEYQPPVALPEENRLLSLCIHPFFAECGFCAGETE